VLEGKRVVITGGAGFIGRALAARLASSNEVVLFDNLLRDHVTGNGLLENPNVSLVRGDILDGEHLGSVFEGATHVVHMAAIVGVRAVVQSPVTTMRVNIMGTFNALEAARAAGVERFVDFSTSEVFGTHAYKVEETHVTPTISVGEGRWTYAVGKLTGEFAAHSYWHEYGLPIVTIRPFNIYGPWRVGQGAVNEIIERALLGEDVVVHGDGSQIRAWCYIDDLIDGTLRALENDDAVGECFNIGNPRSASTVYDTARTIVRLADSPSKLVFQDLGMVDIEVRIPEIDKARRILGYEPTVDLEEGILRTIDWYRAEDADVVEPQPLAEPVRLADVALDEAG
jgi:nucleoside-diphosphate-sugar epimerase